MNLGTIVPLFYRQGYEVERINFTSLKSTESLGQRQEQIHGPSEFLSRTGTTYITQSKRAMLTSSIREELLVNKNGYSYMQAN